MKRKGFTLVEMLGVIALLAVIFALLYPNVMHMLEKGKNADYEEYKDNVFLAAEAYVNSNVDTSELDEVGESVSITYSDLLYSGFLSSKIVNSKTGKTVATEASDGYKVVVTVSSDRTFIYTIEQE